MKELIEFLLRFKLTQRVFCLYLVPRADPRDILRPKQKLTDVFGRTREIDGYVGWVMSIARAKKRIFFWRYRGRS